MVLAPSLLLGGTEAGAGDAVLIVAFFAAVFTLMEYGCATPSLVEFRDAPPVNRIRFAMLALTSSAIAVACDGSGAGASLSRLALAVGGLLGHAMDFPGSPIRLVLWLVPEGADAERVRLLRAASGLAYLVSLVSLTVFAIVIRARAWPAPDAPFNVWINLPRLQPKPGLDMVRRLRRDGAVDLALGLALPYLTPPAAVGLARIYGISMLGSDLAMVWAMSLWAFLPASLLLRGIAIRRLALLLALRRRRLGGDDARAEPAFLPA